MSPRQGNMTKQGANDQGSTRTISPHQKPRPSGSCGPNPHTPGKETAAAQSIDPASWEHLAELSKHCDYKMKWLAFYLAEAAQSTEKMTETQKSLLIGAFRSGKSNGSPVPAFDRFLPISYKFHSATADQEFFQNRLLRVMCALCLPDILEPDLVLLPEPSDRDLAPSEQSSFTSF